MKIRANPPAPVRFEAAIEFDAFHREIVRRAPRHSGTDLNLARAPSLASTMVIGLMILLSRRALAHASPVSEQPGDGATVNSAPQSVVIRFDDRIEAMFATLKVLDGSGDDVTSGKPVVGTDPHQLSVKLKPIAAGSYTVKWSVVAEDGHRTQGFYAFTVAAPKP